MFSDMTVGLDIGYGVVKAVTASNVITFPSVLGHAREIKYSLEKIAQEHPGDQITDDEGTWFVGDLALSQLPSGGLLRLQGRTANKDSLGNQFRVRMAKVALGKLIMGKTGGEVIHIKIATGLPVDHMREAQALKDCLLGQHHVLTDMTDFVANVTEVMVMPQPYGTIYSQTLLPGGELNRAHQHERTGVCDVGTYTVDIALDQNLEYIDSASGSVESGVYTAQERITAMLEAEYGEKPLYSDVERVLRTGKYKAFGEQVDYSQEVQGFLEPLRSATLNLLNTKWKAGSAVDVIYLSGGGADLVFDEVLAAYRQTVKVPHPQLANARGYLSYAEFVAAQPDRL